MQRLMMDSTTASAQMSEMTQCSICLETFKDPKMLPCIHTFCHLCLESFSKDINPGQEATCPLCRKVFSIPPGGVKEVPSNFFMNQLLGVNQSHAATRQSEKSKLCELCSESNEGATAMFFCVECDQSICDKCSVFHKKMKTTKSHQVVSVDDLESFKIGVKAIVNYCEEHPDKQVELYCNDCQLIACVTCYVAKHKRHECVDLKSSAEILCIQLAKDIDNVSACTSRSLKYLEDMDETSSTFNQMLKEFEVRILKKLATMKDEMEHQKVITESFTKYCQEVRDKGTAYDICRAARDLHSRAEELIKTEIKNKCPKLRELDITFSSSGGNAVIQPTLSLNGTIAFLNNKNDLMADVKDNTINHSVFTRNTSVTAVSTDDASVVSWNGLISQCPPVAAPGLNKEISTSTTVTTALPTNNAPPDQMLYTDVLKLVAESIADSDRRKLNLIVFGLPKCNNSANTDADVFTELVKNEFQYDLSKRIVSTKRFGKVINSKSRRLLVSFSSAQVAADIYSYARDLRHSNDSYTADNIYINLDLSPEQLKVAYYKRAKRKMDKSRDFSLLPQQTVPQIVYCSRIFRRRPIAIVSVHPPDVPTPTSSSDPFIETLLTASNEMMRRNIAGVVVPPLLPPSMLEL